MTLIFYPSNMIRDCAWSPAESNWWDSSAEKWLSFAEQMNFVRDSFLFHQMFPIPECNGGHRRWLWPSSVPARNDRMKSRRGDPWKCHQTEMTITAFRKWTLKIRRKMFDQKFSHITKNRHNISVAHFLSLIPHYYHWTDESVFVAFFFVNHHKK